MTPEQLIHYVDDYSISNNFVDSVKKQYEQKGTLTEKQVSALAENIAKHKRCVEFFRDYETGSSDFLDSLQKQFEEKNYLTPKQMLYLKPRSGARTEKRVNDIPVRGKRVRLLK